MFTNRQEQEKTATHDGNFRTERARNRPGRKPGRSKAIDLDQEENLEVV
jgi:hypothetical protein